jgi:hypothetical protein
MNELLMVYSILKVLQVDSIPLIERLLSCLTTRRVRFPTGSTKQIADGFPTSVAIKTFAHWPQKGI